MNGLLKTINEKSIQAVAWRALTCVFLYFGIHLIKFGKNKICKSLRVCPSKYKWLVICTCLNRK